MKNAGRLLVLVTAFFKLSCTNWCVDLWKCWMLLILISSCLGLLEQSTFDPSDVRTFYNLFFLLGHSAIRLWAYFHRRTLPLRVNSHVSFQCVLEEWMFLWSCLWNMTVLFPSFISFVFPLHWVSSSHSCPSPELQFEDYLLQDFCSKNWTIYVCLSWVPYLVSLVQRFHPLRCNQVICKKKKNQHKHHYI